MIARLAWRNLWRSPRRTGIVIMAVAVGIAGCLLSMAFNYGLIDQMIETAIGTELGHVQVHGAGWEEDPVLGVQLADGGAAVIEALRGAPEQRAFARRVRGEGLVNSPRASAGVRVLGVEVDREGEVSLLRDSIVEGDWFGERRRPVVIGAALARRLQVDVGDKVAISVQDAAGELYLVAQFPPTVRRVVTADSNPDCDGDGTPDSDELLLGTTQRRQLILALVEFDATDLAIEQLEERVEAVFMPRKLELGPAELVQRLLVEP